MVEVNSQLPILLKRTTPAPFPTSIALTGSLISGRAQLQVQHKPSTLKTTNCMMQWLSQRKIYEQTFSTAATATMTWQMVTTSAPHYVSPPDYTPEEPIPPKPPPPECPSLAMALPVVSPGTPHTPKRFISRDHDLQATSSANKPMTQHAMATSEKWIQWGNM